MDTNSETTYDDNGLTHVENVAKITHQANKTYCESLGDNSQVDWEFAPEWQKKSAIQGVLFNFQNPDAPASASHESWLKVKEEDGWTYGETKGVEAKTHPCFVPYDELPESQKLKDSLFKAICGVFN